MSFPTRFDPFIKAVGRKAESIYTKMAIQRDESQDLAKRKREDGASDAQSIPWEDTTDVSVIALRGFLEDLLGIEHSRDLLPDTDTLPLPPITAEQPTAPQTAALHAAQAYHATGLAVHDENVEIAEPTPVIPPSSLDTDVRLGDDFGDAERDLMRGYLRELVQLERQGVTFLTLRRSLTFLESIRQAIDAAK